MINNDLLLVLDVVGIISFTISGYVVSVKEKLDLLGVTVISFISAFGGGFIRNISISEIPYIFIEIYPLIVSFLTILLAYIFEIHKIKVDKLNNNILFIIGDSIGLVAFSFSGAIIALNNELNYFGVIFFSLISGIGGSIIRDLFLNKKPYLLFNEFYGTISILMGSFVYMFDYFNLLNNIIIIYFFLLISFTSRIIAIKFKWKLYKVF